MKNVISWVAIWLTRIGAALALGVALTACGGGGGDDVAVAEAVVPEADVTLVQDRSILNVTPGETVRITSLAVKCKQDKTAPGGSDGYCASQVPLGDLGIVVSGLEIMDIKVLIDGQELAGWMSKEADGLYRFRPQWSRSIYRAGSMEVVATISPLAKTGQYSLVVFRADDASFDKTLTVESDEARVEVKALAQYAPMTLTASDGTVTYRGEIGESALKSVNIESACAQGTTCAATIDFWTIQGLVPGSEVQACWVYPDMTEACWVTALSDATGYASIGSFSIIGGQGLSIRVYPVNSASVRAKSVTATTGDKQIAPLLPTNCTAVSSCKG